MVGGFGFSRELCELGRGRLETGPSGIGAGKLECPIITRDVNNEKLSVRAHEFAT